MQYLALGVKFDYKTKIATCSGKAAELQALEEVGFEVVREVSSSLAKEVVALEKPYQKKETIKFQEMAFIKQKRYEVIILEPRSECFLY